MFNRFIAVYFSNLDKGIIYNLQTWLTDIFNRILLFRKIRVTFLVCCLQIIVYCPRDKTVNSDYNNNVGYRRTKGFRCWCEKGTGTSKKAKIWWGLMYYYFLGGGVSEKWKMLNLIFKYLHDICSLKINVVHRADSWKNLIK